MIGKWWGEANAANNYLDQIETLQSDKAHLESEKQSIQEDATEFIKTINRKYTDQIKAMQAKLDFRAHQLQLDQERARNLSRELEELRNAQDEAEHRVVVGDMGHCSFSDTAVGLLYSTGAGAD